MNVNLGTPYESTIKRIIEKGYAGNQTEVIRQAITAYERVLEEEEVRLVAKAVEIEKAQMRSSKAKFYTLAEMEKRYNIH